MGFTVETGDLFAHPAEALAHGVNCIGVAGAGVAAVMKRRYPNAIYQYEVIARRGDLQPGGALICPGGPSDRAIIHCASQNQPGPDATEQWLRSSLTQGLDLARKQGIASVALPLIGGGIGGLDPGVAEQIIREVAEASPVAVTLVLFG
ncbi:RNase III inhibitor [Mycobacteroides abscessus subsp. abscessus]|uniref:macro domain-containing protein n=1 Tax=Mycobacteroides abscessus TaxID=36809 RepID=UPI0009279CD8|nr:macro domain-containing protein [Mycobacteroides abscessus]SIM04943.1 RNase III inhibitor [Mycobacteroides abscessus subsp. abscessus]SKT53058.1 RNase III inhibitor [Mycobacteroides abscessus subsp. massiliense]SLC77663.1 RNase III inhibitor [Mycobacteroides abscessus subsp. abscessus]